MNRLVIIVFGSLMILLSGHLLAQENFRPMADAGAFKENLVKASASINTIASDFIQEKNLSVLTEKIISKGRFAFRKENNIRWEYTEPYKYLIIISNNQMFMRDEKNKKQLDIQSNPFFQEMNKFITGCIKGDILQNDNDYTKEYFENERSYYVKLVPKSEKVKQILNEVHLWFDRNDLSVTKLKMVESGNDYTQIIFTNKILNTEIPLEKFSFK